MRFGAAPVLLLAVCLAPVGAGAAIVPFTGSLSLQVGPFPSIGVTGAGVATVNGSGGGAHLTQLGLASSAISTTAFSMPIPFLTFAPIAGMQLTAHNGAGTIGGFGGAGFGGALPVHGWAKLCNVALCSTGPAANVSIPLAIGSNATATASLLVNVTVVGAPWTTGAVTVGTVAATGFVHGVASGTSSTAAASGAVRLVTPVSISTSIGAISFLPSVATLTLHFVPEPGTLLLLGPLCAGLLLGAHARR